MGLAVAQRGRWVPWVAFLLLGVAAWAVLDAFRGADAAETPVSLVINEIHHNPAAGGVEFIELHSIHDETVDLSGYALSALLTFPDGTLIEPGGFLVVTADLSLFESVHPGTSAIEWNAGESLHDEGELLVLRSPQGEVIDQVDYGFPSIAARYTVDQVIDGTIGDGDGANPNEEAPMGLHDAPLYLPQGWSWAQGPTRNDEWGTFGTGSSLYAEWRCAVIPEYGHTPSVPFRINVRNGSYWQFADDTWSKGFDVDLTGGHRGSYLGDAGQLNTDPYSNGNGQIAWREEADGSFSAPWDADSLMMHFWAFERLPALPGQTAELSTGEMRLQQPDGETVDLSSVDVLFQCGVDYYSVTGGQGTKVPGPGIGKYHWVTTSWKPTLWTTLPPGEPAASTEDFRTWLDANLPPGVAR